jgi:alanine racemase
MSGILRAELSAASLGHNVEQLRRAIGPEVEICAVVKADAYGHGLRVLLPALGPLVDRLAVTLPPTALALRELGWERPILTFFRAAGCAPRDRVTERVTELARAGVTVTVVAEADVELLERVAQSLGRPVEAHLKVDTGMSRSGVLAADAPRLMARLRSSPGVRPTGVYTQIASADAPDLTSARSQLVVFDDALEAMGDTSDLTVHAANSAATLTLPESHYDMVRPGLAVYGCYPSPEMERTLDLRPILRVTAQILELKTVPAGSRTGYGLTHTFPGETLIGLVSVGYADGYPRSLGGRATMRVGGVDVPVCGRVSMDQLVVDLSAAEGVRVGDAVEVVADDPASPHGLEALARLAGTAPYEIACNLGPRVARRLVD